MDSRTSDVAESAVESSVESTIDAQQVREALLPKTPQPTVMAKTPAETKPPAEEPRLLFRRSQRTCRLTGVSIRGIGSYAPAHVVTNAQLEQRYGFEEGWIERRTGILERRFAETFENTSDLAVEAARRAMQNAGVSASEIDLLIVGTFTPDYTCPSTACLVQDKGRLFRFHVCTHNWCPVRGDRKCATSTRHRGRCQ